MRGDRSRTVEYTLGRGVQWPGRERAHLRVPSQNSIRRTKPSELVSVTLQEAARTRTADGHNHVRSSGAEVDG